MVSPGYRHLCQPYQRAHGCAPGITQAFSPPLRLYTDCLAAGSGGQAVYALPDQVVDIFHVLYDERVLRYATEKQLDRRFQAQWEDLRGEPIYYTTENQNPGTIRIIPAPVRTGSTVPVITPLSQDIRGTSWCSTAKTSLHRLTVPQIRSPGLLDFDDTLVWETVRQLAERETERQNLPVAQCAAQLLALWEQYLVLKSG